MSNITGFPIPTKVFDPADYRAVINVKDYGATGDGTTNDTAAIQAALDAVPAGGGMVFVPKGTYRVLNIHITVAGTHLVGEGDGSCLKLIDSPGSPAGGASVLRINRDGVTPLANVRVAHLQIDGNKSTFGSVSASAEGIDADNTLNLTVEHCYVHDVNGDAMDFDGANPGLMVLHNRIKDTHLQALHVYGANDALVQGNQIENCSNTPHALANHPIDFLQGGGVLPDGIRCIGNAIRNCGGGIDVRSVQGALVAHNTITDTTNDIGLGEGILVRSNTTGVDRRIIVRGNYVRNTPSGAAGILLTGAGILVEGNTLVKNGHGVMVIGSENEGDNIIRNNLIVEPILHGVWLSGSLNSLVEGNTILNPTSRGIYLLGRSGVSVRGAVLCGNIIKNSGSSGIGAQIANSTETTWVENNRIEQGPTSGTGIQLLGSTTWAQVFIVRGNTVVGNAAVEGGIDFRYVTRAQVIGNIVEDIGTSTNILNAIRLRQVNNAFVHGNRTRNYLRGLDVGPDFTNGVVTENDVRGQNSGSSNTPMRIGTGTGNIIRRNYGVVTEASGTATVADTATHVDVTHGLASTPEAKDISVTPTNGLGDAAKFWISDIGASTFRINVNADPGATTATFAWQAAIL